MELTIYTAKAGNVEMRYFTFGEGTKDMVILPGLSLISVMESAEAVAGAYEMFAKEYRVWLFDRRENLPTGYTIPDMADDTAKVMKVLNIRNAYVFGASQGGMIATCLAAEYPDLVRKLILASTAATGEELSENIVIKGWIKLAEERKLRELILSFLEMNYTKETFLTLKDSVSDMEKMVGESETERFIFLAKTTGAYCLSDEAGKIKCPVLVLGAYGDRIFDSREMKDLAAKCHGDLYLYEGYSHAVYDEAPDYKGRILAFFHDDAVEGKSV